VFVFTSDYIFKLFQDEKFHSRLAVIYVEAMAKAQQNGAQHDETLRLRKKFQRFLQESNLYKVQTVLSKIKGMGLDQETATLYGKVCFKISYS
jgi:hypothetical protein